MSATLSPTGVPLPRRAWLSVRTGAIVAGSVPVASRLRSVPRSLWFSITALCCCLAATAVLASWRLATDTHGVPGPAGLRQVWRSQTGEPWPLLFSVGEWRRLQAQNRSFAGLALYQPGMVIVGDGDAAERVRCMYVSDNYFEVTGISQVNRAPLWRRAAGSGSAGVVIGTELCRRLHPAGDCVGRSLLVNGNAFSITAVAPRSFAGAVAGMNVVVWIPLRFMVQLTGNPLVGADDANIYGLLARIYREVDPEVGAGRVRAAVAALATTPANAQISAESIWKPRPMIFGLMVYVGYVSALLTALAVQAWMNTLMVAALTVLRRTREFTIRMVCGGWRRHFIVQIVTELSLPLVIATAAGTALFGTAIAISRQSDVGWLVGLPFIVEFNSVRLMLAVLVLTTAAVAIPLFVIAALLTPTSAQAIANARRRRRSFARYLLIATQVSVSAIIATFAVLIVRGVRDQRGPALGFRTAGIATARLDPAMQGYDTARAESAYAAITRSLRESGAEPAMATWIPGAGMIDRISTGEGTAGRRQLQLRTLAVTPGFLRLTALPLVAGRDFREAENDERAAATAILSASAARSLFGSPAAAIGRTCLLGDRGVTVVGVTADARLISIYDPPPATAFVPLRQFALGSAFVFAAMPGASDAARLRAFESAIRAADRHIGIFAARTFDDAVSDAEKRPAAAAALCAVIAGVCCLLMSCNGIFTMISYAVAQSSREIAIRRSLGARPVHLLQLLGVAPLVASAAGIAVAMLAVSHFAGTIAAVVPVTRMPDAATLAGTAAAIGVVVVISASLPIRQLLRAEIVTLLHGE